MKFKHLLLLSVLFICGIMNAQVNRSLVITEARLNGQPVAYIEVTNMGATALNLSEFELGKVTPWTSRIDTSATGITKWFNVPGGDNPEYMMLPDVVLQPGESYTIASGQDWTPEMEQKDPFKYGYRASKLDVHQIADYIMHFPEAPYRIPADSVDKYYRVMEVWNGRDTWYLRHHTGTDSVVIDQVGGIWDGNNGQSRDVAHDVAGATNATNTRVLVRKFSVKEGNIDFDAGRGIDLANSEWIPIPFLGQNSGRRPSFWTMDTHGNYTLDENTLESTTLSVDFANGVITVPWGIRRDDSLMFEFTKKPGIAWHYHYSPIPEDSVYLSARTGDTLTVYVCGNTLMEKSFRIEVAAPTADANIVVPKKELNDDGFIDGYNAGLYSAFCQATNGVAGMDTIMHINGITGIPYATRGDTLLKYLEKAPEAEWEFVYVDGIVRPDLKHGDKLKVTAKNGSVKEYFIKVDIFRPSHNAYMGSITWPDIPLLYKDKFGWIGDTIPNFVRTKYEYKVQVPAITQGIPALVGKTEHVNAKLEVKRATNLAGSDEAKTVTFTVTAEDDTSVLEYNVVLEKQKPLEHIQPYEAEPFISQFVFWEQWNNGFVEVVNSGNQPLDLSNYMFFNGYENTPSTAIAGWSDWAVRYQKYIPGCRWTTSEEEWNVQRNVVIQDANVNPVVAPGDVFVMGHVLTTTFSGESWFARQQCDIDFSKLPWGEDYGNENSVARQWMGANFYIFKILNDSVKNGTKPATDPNDFELIETFGSGDGSDYTPILSHKTDMINGFTRKPEYYLPKPGFKESFGDTTGGIDKPSEWTVVDRPYYQALGVGWPAEILLVADGLGSHFMNEVTIYKSTITTSVYKVTGGYSLNESLWGVVTGTTSSQFLNNIIKADAGQTLTVKSGVDGSVKADDAAMLTNDTLVVVSADMKNTSKYIIEVSDDGLNSNAVLTSNDYQVTVNGDKGTVTGFDYGTKLATVLGKLTKPQGSQLTVIDDKNAYVPLKMLNYDTLYNDVEVSTGIYLEVIAEDGVTKIVYQLMPNGAEEDVRVTSNVFVVNQETAIIDLIPEGTTVFGLMKYLIPSPGATIKVVNKMGQDRTSGYIFKDDRVVVTSEDGTKSKTYFLQVLNQKATYLAYVVSDVYNIDQTGLVIAGFVTEIPTIEDFLANLTPASGATVKVYSSTGTEKTGNQLLEPSDIVRVTASDGITVVNYANTIQVSVDKFANRNINVYPNPTSGMVTISGLNSTETIAVFNMVGVKVLERKAYQNNEELSLANLNRGIYYIVVSENNDVVGRYKVILK